MTTPSPLGGRIHKIMAFLGLLSRHAAEQHKDFYDLVSMKELIHPAGFVVECYIPFQLGMN